MPKKRYDIRLIKHTIAIRLRKSGERNSTIDLGDLGVLCILGVLMFVKTEILFLWFSFKI